MTSLKELRTGDSGYTRGSTYFTYAHTRVDVNFKHDFSYCDKSKHSNWETGRQEMK